MKYWSKAEVIDSDGTLALIRDGFDMLYAHRPNRPHRDENGDVELSAGEHQAWINLVVAAPTMLETLKAITANCGCGEIQADPCANCIRADAAIAKAEGAR
jgi:hypothetical protein